MRKSAHAAPRYVDATRVDRRAADYPLQNMLAHRLRASLQFDLTCCGDVAATMPAALIALSGCAWRT
jgi:hypothetical protein